MAAGQHIHQVGVLRIVVGDIFQRQAVVEIHKGIEDAEGKLYFAQLEGHEIEWETFQGILGKTDTDALVRILKKVGEHVTEEKATLERSTLLAYDEARTRTLATPEML
jgi:hypothetical protein